MRSSSPVHSLAPSRTLLWAPALLVAGVACVVNAAHCHRLHCFLTGPLFLCAAVVTVLRGTEMVALPWAWIGFAIASGTVLAHLPEWITGKYVGTEHPARATNTDVR